MNPELDATMARILANARQTPDTRTYKCRCGSMWKRGEEVSVGWVEVSTEGRGTYRPCEVCRRVDRSVVAPARETSFT